MATTNTRHFSGRDTQQVDANGKPADPKKWYYEPKDYDGDVLFSCAYGSESEADGAAFEWSQQARAEQEAAE